MYADDTSLYNQSNDVTQLNEAMNNDLKLLDNCLQGNKLSLNVAETHSMLLTTKQKHRILEKRHEIFDLKFHGNELYLGVQID